MANTLPEGARLGPYEILGLLGAGGMGEVYRARDPRLGRTVAIKILPAEFSADESRAWRFEREAKAVASLNHPHICTVHDIGDHDGHRYLVMEMMEGQPLDRRLTAGPLPLALLLDLSVQIADALEAAHTAGVIHRDLKPANIFLTKRGEAKLLDFGLAKLADTGEVAGGLHATSAGDFASSPTMASPGGKTTFGSVLGTAAYMSPEQARGETVTAQSDLFSFGLVLYEMAAGRPAFSGNTMAVLFDAILNRQPPSLSSVNPQLPADLSRIVEKALEKDPELRFQSAADMRADLKRVRRDVIPGRASDPAIDAIGQSVVAPPGIASSGAAPRNSASRSPQSGAQKVATALGLDVDDEDAHPAARKLRKKRRRRLVLMAILALVASRQVYKVWQRDREPRPSADSRSLSLDSLQVTQLTSTGTATRPALSPDGKYVVYLQRDADGQSAVWLRQTAAPTGVKLMSGEAQAPIVGATVGPDSTFVDVLRGATLWRVPFLGGAPKLLLDQVTMPIGWSPDGTHMAFVRGIRASAPSALVVANRDGGDERVLATRLFPAAFVTTSLAGATAVAPAWSPDGHQIAVLQRLGEDIRDMGVSIFDADDGDADVVKVRGDVPQGIAWLDRNTLLVAQALEQGTPSQLWRVAVDDGARARLTNDVGRYADLSVSADGDSLVTSRPETRVSLWVGDASGNGRDVVASSTFLSQAAQYATVAWDGDDVLFTHTLNGRFEIFRIGADSHEGRDGAIPVIAGRDMAAHASGIVVYRSTSGDDLGLWKTDRSGRNPVELAKGAVNYPSISRDGQHVVFSSPAGGVQAVWTVPVAGGTPVQVTDQAVGVLAFSDVSPDGRSIVMVLRNDWAICEFPRCMNPKPFELHGSRPRWAADGRGVTYVDLAGTNVWLQPLDRSAPRQLTHFDANGPAIGGYAWSADGRRIALSRASSTSDIVLFRGLRQRRPANR